MVTRKFPDKIRTLFLKSNGSKTQPFVLEVAQDDATRARGLMYRAAMPLSYGMLFVFDEPVWSGFWMKQTFIPLDIAWLDEHGVVLDVARLNPLDETLKRPREAAKYAVELHAGTLAQYGVGVGDKLVGLKE